eukprot:scaffold74897_cov92-Phaeocystis_antarctica.AAC.2
MEAQSVRARGAHHRAGRSGGGARCPRGRTRRRRAAPPLRRSCRKRGKARCPRMQAAAAWGRPQGGRRAGKRPPRGRAATGSSFAAPPLSAWAPSKGP